MKQSVTQFSALSDLFKQYICCCMYSMPLHGLLGANSLPVLPFSIEFTCRCRDWHSSYGPRTTQ